MATASNEFKLIGPRAEFKDSAVTLSCRLSPEISAVDLEIRWFKETDCVCVYKNSKVTEGRGYKGRVSLFTQELERGNVSLQLRNCIESDRGHYLCQVTDGDRTEEITVEMNPPELFGDVLSLKDVCVYQRDRKWTEDERKKMEKSVLLTASSEEDELSDLLSKTEISGDLGIQTLMEVFIPELVENYAGNKNKDEYRFICHHAGQFMCKLTNLVFEMDGKGEVLYRIVSWDSSYLDGLGQLQPAGPLYSIACHEGSIRHLHLPHCEICTDEVKLSTAHVTGGNVELIQPLKVTNTHVIIDIQGLSLFGLLKCISLKYPVKAQVILFYKKKNGDSGMSKLHMHLLPGNVPVEEVHKRHRSMTYIETSSNCELTSGKKYRPCCKDTDHEYVLQPRIVKFECDYGPNYHPTFEMLCKTEVDKVTVGLLDKNKQEVWEPRLVLLAGADFMDRHMDQLIQRVSSVMEIADCLKSKMMISDEKYNKIHAASTSCEQMRLLYSSLNAGGRVVKAEAYKVLKEKEPHLVDELNRSSQF